MSDIPNDITKLSFEKALAELEEIVENLENGSIDLEKSIEFYTRGSHLKAHCQQKLNDAVLKLEEIKVSSDGKVSKKEIE
ncbi:exodeoxyribonuclease VII small subunit [Pelagibacterales bacterium]|jgi:exodeoxyribonuclease VII small subunit|nr:exodeoxyribonuclease VII small subunit [Pelagibacterales bacterium]MDA9136931.1 exodeoxyribonuclease VII small subunit [Pelagibacterales bacterium]MDA9372939.1 exodeoxyribonuclease VII small subunit [Pelagibacterales bacterium]MDA9981057.1 exodeoxyribonuclease VII small subunit [Pelagibacterales bacterium]MDB9817821.1 exodeoxyribonuclease VII small subunit [Pelagibacterales bacterium]|tara:strand:- start:63 stop:302 length:240 start_codon:yes stop_codon:yes gene_type:complete